MRQTSAAECFSLHPPPQALSPANVSEYIVISLSLKRRKIPPVWVGTVSLAFRRAPRLVKCVLVSLCWVRDIRHVPSAKRLPHTCHHASAMQAAKGTLGAAYQYFYNSAYLSALRDCGLIFDGMSAIRAVNYSVTIMKACNMHLFAHQRLT